MKKHHFGILVLTLVFLVGGLTSYTFSRNGLFPVAKVNGDFISYKTVKENADVSRRLYAQGLAGSSPDLDNIFKRGSEKELFKNSLENLIINLIIKSSAAEEDLVKAQKEVEASFNSKTAANLSGVLQNVYSWDAAKFKERILEPQALLQIVSQKEGQNFDSWLKSAKANSTIRIWFLPYRWEDGNLVNRN
ncbi:MAG: SurA N-terminal domain-containing protein [Patescibacteria group bacterium]